MIGVSERTTAPYTSMTVPCGTWWGVSREAQARKGRKALEVSEAPLGLLALRELLELRVCEADT
ncbi:MAG: hypothetical protein OXC91_05635 [Rhodobacteraceae bacterium]|nr:hypothetical protein [Paracoccaceae bacterium]